MHYLESRIHRGEIQNPRLSTISFHGATWNWPEEGFKETLLNQTIIKNDDIMDVHFQTITRWSREFFLVVKRGTKSWGNYQSW